MQRITIENWLQRNSARLRPNTQFRIEKLQESQIKLFAKRYSSAVSRHKKRIVKGTVTHDGIANGILNKMQIGQYDRNF